MIASKLAMATALGLLSTTFGSSSAERPQSVGLFEVGRPVPALEFPTIDGQSSIALGGFEGKRVLLLQFASW